MERVILPFNPVLKDEIEKIRFAIQAEQNGVASRSMGCVGYKKNYGVTFPVLKGIAEPYVGNALLADCLWNSNFRETMIVATLIYPAGDFSREHAMQWLEQMQCLEIVQYACQNLYSKLSYAAALITDLLSASAPFALEMVYNLEAALIEQEKFEVSVVNSLLDRVQSDMNLQRNTLCSSVSLFLKKIGVYTPFKKRVLSFVNDFSESKNMMTRWVAEEVRTEVEYSDEKPL